VSKTAGKSHEAVIQEIAAIVGRDISVETTSQDTAGMIEKARRFAARAGAYIISPFVGRLDDIAMDGMQVVRDTVEIYRQHQLPSLVLAARATSSRRRRRGRPSPRCRTRCCSRRRGIR
jgi:transaldolase